MKRGNTVLRCLACAVLLGALTTLALFGLRIDSSFADLLPGERNAATIAFERLSKVGGRQVNVLLLADTPDAAASAAHSVEEKLPDGVEVMAADGGVDNIAALLSPYRFQLLSQRHRKLMQEGQDEALREEALANLYSFIPLSLYPPEEEPYAFTSAFLLENPVLSFAGMAPENGVLMGAVEKGACACLPLLLPEDCVASPKALNAVMQQIVSACGLRDDGSYSPGDKVRILLSGTPVHTWLTSRESMHTMSALGIVSTLMVVFLFYGVFRSLRGLGVMVLTLSAGALTAAGAVAALFGHVHLIALVFACSLVGLSTDYIVHYLVAHGREAGSDGPVPSPRFSRPLTLALLAGFGSTAAGYLLFCFCGMPMLTQIAVLAMAGLGGVVLFMFAFYEPLFCGCLPIHLSPVACRAGSLAAKSICRQCVPWVLALLLLIPCVNLRFNDDLRSFYEPPPHLLEAEKTMAVLSGQEQGVLCFLVQGADAEDVLRREEQLTARLQEKNFPYRAVSSLVPSAARQQSDFERVKVLTDKYQEELPISPAPEWHGALKPEKLFSSTPALASLAPLWGGCTSLVIVADARKEELKHIAASLDGVSLEDRFGDLAAGMGRYRQRLLLLLLCGLVPAWGIWALHRGAWYSLRMLGPVVCGVMAVFGGLALCGIPVSLFHVLGCFLVVGLGYDYVVFRDAQGDEKNIGLAVVLSFLTTLLMFGVLALTSFAVTRDIGVAISLGLTVTFLLSSAATRRPEEQGCKASCAERK